MVLGVVVSGDGVLSTLNDGGLSQVSDSCGALSHAGRRRRAGAGAACGWSRGGAAWPWMVLPEVRPRWVPRGRGWARTAGDAEPAPHLLCPARPRATLRVPACESRVLLVNYLVALGWK